MDNSKGESEADVFLKIEIANFKCWCDVMVVISVYVILFLFFCTRLLQGVLHTEIYSSLLLHYTLGAELRIDPQRLTSSV